MGELVNDFGGKVSGELIKPTDWNGMLAKVEQMIDTVANDLGTRIDKLEVQADSLETRVNTAEDRLNDAETTLNQVRGRLPELKLSTTTTRFAIGQRGTITAQVTALDGTPLDLSNAATRPWVDFVTVWGTLKAANGFTSRGGAGDQTLSVQVNSNGVAQALIRAAHAESFAEEDELEIEGFLSTQPVAASSSTIADMVLAANTPHDGAMSFAYQAMSVEYDRTTSNNTPVFQRYIDAYYVTQPASTVGNFASVYTQRWRDYRATVMAFLKPDSNPTTADGALASASIQVTFRDWIAPWVLTDYLPAVGTIQLDYGQRFQNLIGPSLGLSIDGIVGEVEDIIRDKGIIGRQRDLQAIDKAIGSLRFTADPPPFMTDLVQAIQFGSQVQHAMIYSQSLTPGDTGEARGFGAIAGSVGQASAEASRIKQQLTDDIDTKLTNTTTDLQNQVNVMQVKFQEELLREDGPILNVQREVQTFSGQVQGLQAALNNKADVGLITSIVGTIPR
jgi:hypothetical protein